MRRKKIRIKKKENKKIIPELKENDVLRNQYKLIKKVGKGHFSKVWEAFDERNNINVAIKILKGKKKYEEMFEYEADALKIIKNNYTEGLPIVKFINHFIHIGHICIVFELLPYSLSDLIDNGENGLSFDIVKKITKQILEGVKFLHSHGIIHTDIKPDNILLTKKPEDIHSIDDYSIKICDFNTIRLTSEKLDDGDCIQTREYMALESLLNSRYKSNVDLWSIGCVCYELYTGDYLFDPHYAIDNTDDDSNDENEHLLNGEHLYQIQRALGRIPKEVLDRGKRTRKYFERSGKLKGCDKIEIKTISERLIKNYEKDPEESKKMEEILLPMFEYDRIERVSVEEYLNKNLL